MLLFLKNNNNKHFFFEDDCEMFIMVLKQQWPKYKDAVPESTLEIVKDIDMPRMLDWTFQQSDQKVKSKIGEQIIVPYGTDWPLKL
ncbi:MAG: hypothetical protein CM15mP98_04150 [Paracoccaceae bacterium]|nr:MAG: hypothetical protein CM15mP98_04150 [Paracoccaceae bacterium]